MCLYRLRQRGQRRRLRGQRRRRRRRRRRQQRLRIVVEGHDLVQAMFRPPHTYGSMVGKYGAP